MQFSAASIRDIRAISQRSLAMHWSRAAGDAPFPSHETYRAPERGHDPKQMVIWEVVQTDGRRAYHAQYQGDHVVTGFHGHWLGSSMADLLPSPLKEPALAGADHCAAMGQAVYMIYRTADANGDHLDCERLLLPLGTATGDVRQIIASMEVIGSGEQVVFADALPHFLSGFEIVFAGAFQPLRTASQPKRR